MGSHNATILPRVEFDERPMTTPVVTIQLHNTASMRSVLS